MVNRVFSVFFSIFFSEITSLLCNLFQFDLSLLTLTWAAFATVLLLSFLHTLFHVAFTYKINLGPFIQGPLIISFAPINIP